MTVLSVNLNKVALLRNSREGQRPSVIEFARLAIAAGAGVLPCTHGQISDMYEPVMCLLWRLC
ncbi:MAG: hypothetical protein CM15mP120_12760 [Pseudomonadota bacterium]|nr:MAG: hypothetical protein CM15mP120_12760 [Pseudomonadota bacterium]